MSNLTFNEVIQGFPSYRVFIFGQEVTQDCPDINIQWTSSRAPSFATITLLNPNDRYIYRRDDMVLQYQSKLQPFISQTNSDLTDLYLRLVTDGVTVRDSIGDPTSIKSQITKLKQNAAYSVNIAAGNNPLTGGATPATTAQIYPVIEGKSCFHQNDPVRIFVQDPFDPAVWYYGFSGFITQVGDSVDGANLEQTLSIQVEDASKALRYARYSMNPGLRDPSKINTAQDLQQFNGFTLPIQNMSLQEAADIIVYGGIVQQSPPDSALYPVAVVDPNTGQSFNKLIMKTGAGNFKPLATKDRIHVLTQSANPARTVITLPDWQDMLDQIVSIDDISVLRARSNNPTSASQIITTLESDVAAAQDAGEFDVTITSEIITTIGSDPVNYPVDGGALYMLLPEGLSVLGQDVVSREFISTIAMVSELKDRRSLMYDLVDRVEFVFYADPKGNLIIEFPLYDFDPDDFNDANINSLKQKSIQNSLPPSVQYTITQPNGDYIFDNERRFTIEDDTVENFTATDDDAPVKTICLTVPSVGRYTAALAGNGLQAPVRTPQVVRLDALIPIYGPRLTQGDPRRLTLTERAALLASAIALNKSVAEAYTFKINMLPRFGAWINRPYLIRRRNHIGTAVSISHRISWASSIQTTIGLNYTRGWQGDMESSTGRMIYVPIGGAQSRPLNYAVMFAQNKTTNNSATQTTSGSGTQGS